MATTKSDPSEELDFSDPSGNDFESLARDRLPIRSMAALDLGPIVEIDRRITGQVRRSYFERLMGQVLGRTGVRVSLVAEHEGQVIGFVMARVDYGEFGRAEPVAVLDTIGIHPNHQHHEAGAALLSQLFINLAALRIERVRTVTPWDGFDIQQFFAVSGFRPAQRLCLWMPLTEKCSM